MSTRTGVRDGLGGNVVQAGSEAALPTQDLFLTGSMGIGGPLTVANSITATTTINATTNVSGTGSVFGGVLSTPKNVHLSVGSPYGQGLVIQLLARTNVSGGTWVTASGNLAVAGPASTNSPIGVSQPGINVASGGTVNVIIKGVVPMIADGTVATAIGVKPGAGAALNTVSPFVAGSTTNYATLSDAGSEGVVFVVL